MHSPIEILPVKDEHFPLLKDFILPYEYTCTALASHVRREEDHIFVITRNHEFNKLEDLIGILYCDGTLLFCIPSSAELLNSEFQQVFINFQKNNRIKCIIGEKEVSELFCSILAIATLKPYQIFNYDLMVLDCEPNPPLSNLSCDDYIKRCTEDDLENLLDIQKKYLIQEVAPEGKIVTSLEASASLKQILKTQLCLALLTDQEIVAKANSNAIGWNFVQIGGVFTHPLYRRNSYAWHLVYELCVRIQKTYRYVSLFVKEKNYGAFNLYQKIGFAPACKFQIAYFA